MKFQITIFQDEDGMYIAECPAIPGCISQGKTESEAEKNIHEAIKECLAVRGLALQFLSFAKAYLDSAAFLCNGLCETPQESSFSRGSVVLFLAFHAVELFLKGAILTRSKNEKLHHDIKVLKQRYDNLFPEPEFSWDIPFKTEYIGDEPPQIEVSKQKIQHDQVYRYPCDRNKKEWEGVFAFNAIWFSGDIKTVAANFSRLETIIFDV